VRRSARAPGCCLAPARRLPRVLDYRDPLVLLEERARRISVQPSPARLPRVGRSSSTLPLPSIGSPSDHPAAAALGTTYAAGLGATPAVSGAGAAGLGMAAAAGHHVAAGAPTAASARAADLAAAHRTAAATSAGHHNAAGAPTAATARAADFGPSGFGLQGYPTCAGVLTCLPSPTRLTGHPPPGFPPTRPLVADATWASPHPSTDSTLPSTIAAIQAALAASQERERTTSRALDQEHALAATLTAQMATVQRLILNPPPVDPGTPPPTPDATHTSGLEADHIAALHAQAAGLQNIWSLVSVVFGPGVLPLPSL
jgi:hypothetical protein